MVQRSKVPRRRMVPFLGDAHRAQLRRDDLRNVAVHLTSRVHKRASTHGRHTLHTYMSTSRESDDIEHRCLQVHTIITLALQPCIHIWNFRFGSRIRNTWRNDVTPERLLCYGAPSTCIMPSCEQISVLPHQHQLAGEGVCAKRRFDRHCELDWSTGLPAPQTLVHLDVAY